MICRQMFPSHLYDWRNPLGQSTDCSWLLYDLVGRSSAKYCFFEDKIVADTVPGSSFASNPTLPRIKFLHFGPCSECILCDRYRNCVSFALFTRILKDMTDHEGFSYPMPPKYNRNRMRSPTMIPNLSNQQLSLVQFCLGLPAI
jgi:hypothetical protein